MPNARLTKLEAVNRILQLLGQVGVNSISPPGTADAALALATLDRIDRAVQAKGWHFNTEEEVTLTRDTADRIPVSADVLSVDAFSPAKNVVRRGAFLWDRDDNTDEFSDDLKVNLIRFLDWDDTPPVYQNYTMVRAGREVVESLEDTSRSGFTRTDEAQAWHLLLEKEGWVADETMLDSDDYMRWIRNRGPEPLDAPF